MLLLMMELRGRFNTKMIKKAKFGDVYFDELGAFQSVETDRITGTVRNSCAAISANANHFPVALIGRRAQGSHHEAVTRLACEAHARGSRETEGRRAQDDHVVYRSAR